MRSPEPIVAPPGDEVVFECSLNVPAEQVRWRHNGRFLHHHGNETGLGGSGNHSPKSNRLVVEVHDDQQAGDYQVSHIVLFPFDKLLNRRMRRQFKCCQH